MPRLPDVPQVVRIDLHQTIGEDTAVVNRMFWNWLGTGLGQTDVNDMANDVNAEWGMHMDSIFGTFQALNYVVVTDLSSATGAVGVNSTEQAGTDTGDPLAADTAMRLKFLQGRRYRGGHPGVYLGGFVEDRLQDAQTWSSATLAEVSTAWTNFVGALPSAGGPGGSLNQQVNVSYYEGFTAYQNPVTGRWRNVPNLRVAPLVTPITGFEIDVHVSSQRRRSLIRR